MRIEGAGHCVDMEVNDTNWTPEKLSELVEGVWCRTRVTVRRMQVGYGSQMTSMDNDSPVHGNPTHERGPATT